ncbi:MAG TPA: tetratricopeptide repeat protein [Tepidisphaeraceae bacterium]|nr:tetratricopeptide repeat protein [Tepidisphaeraceae bacterium]
MATLTIGQAFELAQRHHLAGRIDYAQVLLRQILGSKPDHVGALKLLAQVTYQTGRADESIELLRRAIGVSPDAADLHANLANVLSALGRPDDAIASYQRAVALDPALAEAWNNLGAVLAREGRAQEAVDPLRRAAALRPQSVGTWFNLGAALNDAGRFEESAAAFRRVIELQPDHVEARTSLGNVLWELGRLPQAMEHLHEALRLRADFPEALVNLANCVADERHTQEAIELYQKAMHSPEHEAAARYNLGLLMLREGKLAEGFELYEARRKLQKLRCGRDFPQPRWGGGRLEGRTILLHAEQGLGDTIQLIRYVPMVIARGGRVIVQCQPPLRRLLEGQCEIERLVSEGEPLGLFDVHCPLMSLPQALGTTLDSIPADVPYLFANPIQIDRWRDMLSNEPAGLRVGVAWAGNPENRNDWRRSIPLSTLAPLGQVPCVRFHSIQKGEPAKQAQCPPSGMIVKDWSDQLADFVDTAALIANLDLVISVDTAVAHLAGAMGTPVWLLLPKRADWRWMLDRDDSPWYPTMKLFRQKEAGQWGEAVERVKNRLLVFSSSVARVEAT